MRVLAVLALLCLALAQVELASVTKGGSLVRNTRVNRRRRPPPLKAGRLQYAVTHYLDAQLDHFNISDDRIWQQRYFANSELYQEGGPVFVYLEGEAEADSGWIERGNTLMYVLAEELKANLFLLEHRFFGQSRPTKDLSTENLIYLTSDQALADLAYFIEYLIEKGDISKDQKVIVFGGSYAGNLAGWARLKYPHLVHAAVSSSAPVHAKEDFLEYMEVVSTSLRRVGGDACADNIKKAFDRIQKLLLTTDGPAKIQDQFYMCQPPNTTNKLDMDFMYEIMSNPFAGAVQYNRPDGGWSESIDEQCTEYKNTLTDDEAVAALADTFVNSQGWIFGCVYWDYASNMKSLSDVAYYDGTRQWIYMTCAAFGYFQTADGDTLFPKGYFDVPFDIDQCKLAFGDRYNDNLAQRGVSRTNLEFGDWTPDVTNVIFVNGDIDPWHALGVLEDVNESSPAILISGTSHCYDMFPNRDGDSDELVAARAKISQFVKDALYSSPNGNNPTISP